MLYCSFSVEPNFSSHTDPEEFAASCFFREDPNQPNPWKCSKVLLPKPRTLKPKKPEAPNRLDALRPKYLEEPLSLRLNPRR